MRRAAGRSGRRCSSVPMPPGKKKAMRQGEGGTSSQVESHPAGPKSEPGLEFQLEPDDNPSFFIPFTVTFFLFTFVLSAFFVYYLIPDIAISAERRRYSCAIPV